MPGQYFYSCPRPASEDGTRLRKHYILSIILFVVKGSFISMLPLMRSVIFFNTLSNMRFHDIPDIVNTLQLICIVHILAAVTLLEVCIVDLSIV